MGLFSIRSSGWTGPVDRKGEAAMCRTDKHGKPLSNFGWTGTNSKDDKRGRSPGKLAKGSKDDGKKGGWW
jgi:hypothetical protein